MSNILIINAHHTYPFSIGRLNATLVENAETLLTEKGHQVRSIRIDDGWEVDTEIENHLWADSIILQTPVNWMGVPWPFKKYMDEVYTQGMSGSLCNGDGRTRENPKQNYGGGGSLTDRHYMLSLTFNAPEEAFGNEDEYLFQGKSVDDLLFPMHMNFRFFGMQAKPTFACFDVMKNADTENDLRRFTAHINSNF